MWRSNGTEVTANGTKWGFYESYIYTHRYRFKEPKEHNWDSRQTLEVTEYSTQTQRAALAVHNLELLSANYDVFIVIKVKQSLIQHRNQ